MEYWVMWLVIVILLTIIEFATVNLVSIWFVISGILSLIISIFTDNFLIQFGVFVLGGILLLLMTKPLLKKMKLFPTTKINLDRIIGMDGIVTEEIKKNIVGEVKVDGKLWSAVADETIPVDTVVKVEKIDGVKLVVKNDDPERKQEEKLQNKTKKPKKKKLDGPVVGKRIIEISGMHCQNCVNSVTRALNSIDGVAAKVSLRDSRADVLLDRMVDENDLRHAVEGAGFKVISIKSS